VEVALAAHAGSHRRAEAKRNGKLNALIAYFFGKPLPGGKRESPGKSACDLCHLQGLEAGVRKAATPAEQICFANRAAGPGGCINPEPSVHYRLAGIWAVFGLVQQDYRNDGLTGQWHRPSWADIAEIVRGCGEPWDALTISRLTAWLSGFDTTLPKPSKK
jgi:hypothetical protein